MVNRTNRFKAYVLQRRRELRIAGEWSDDPAENADRLNADLLAFLESNGLKRDYVTIAKREMQAFIKEITVKRVCPACGEAYYGDPAVSRRNGKEICPMCALREALEDAGLDAGETVRKLRE